MASPPAVWHFRSRSGLLRPTKGFQRFPGAARPERADPPPTSYCWVTHKHVLVLGVDYIQVCLGFVGIPCSSADAVVYFHSCALALNNGEQMGLLIRSRHGSFIVFFVLSDEKATHNTMLRECMT